MDQAQQQMLGTDVVVVQHPGLFLRSDYSQPRPSVNRSNSSRHRLSALFAAVPDAYDRRR